MKLIKLLIVMIVGVHGIPWRTIQLRNSEVIFENMGKILEYQSEIKIFTRIRISGEIEINNFIISLENRFNQTCSEYYNNNQNIFKGKTNNSKLCSLWEHEIKFWENKIIKISQGLNHYFKRQKRGAIDMIGSISKGLFGTMDQTDADKIYTTLNQLTKNGNNMLELLDKQTAIVVSNFEFLHQVTGNLTMQTEVLEDKLNKIKELITEKNKEFGSELEINRVVMFILSELERLYGYLTEQETVVTALQQHKIHPLLIDTEFLSKLVFNLTEGMAHELLYSNEVLNQLATVNRNYLKGEMGIQITIKILQKEEFNLYKIYTVPKLFNKQLLVISPEWDYLANNTAGHIIHYSKEEFNIACSKITTINIEMRICKQIQPKILELTAPQCLLKHFVGCQENIPVDPNCQYNKLVEIENHIIPMKTKNNWLYIFPHKKTLTAICKRQTHKIKLTETGILSLIEKCTFLLENLELPFEDTKNKMILIQNTFTISNWSDFKNNSTESWAEELQLKDLSEKIKPLNSELLNKEFIKRSHSLQQITKEIKDQKKNQFENRILTITTASNTTGIILLLLIILIISIRNHKMKRNINKQIKTIKEIPLQQKIIELPKPSIQDNVKEISKSKMTETVDKTVKLSEDRKTTDKSIKSRESRKNTALLPIQNNDDKIKNKSSKIKDRTDGQIK